MTCLNDTELTRLSADLVDKREAAEWRDHLERCDRCHARFRLARRQHADLLRTYEAFDRDHDERREQLMASLPRATPQVFAVNLPARWWRSTGDFVMTHPRIVRRAAVALVPAAAIVIALVLFTSSDGGRAFARVIEQLQQVDNIAARVTSTLTGGPQDQSSEGRLLVSSRFGSRFDIHVDGDLLSSVYSPLDGPTVAITPATKTWIRIESAEADGQARAQERPDQWLDRLQGLTAEADRELDDDVIDGHNVRGWWIAGHKLGLGNGPGWAKADPQKWGQGIWEGKSWAPFARLWVDAETWLPVRFDIEMSGPTEGSWMKITHDRFEWNKPVGADTFTPDIPEGYTRLDLKLPAANERTLIDGLRAYADLSGGKYPPALDAARVPAELAGFFAAKLVAGGAKPDPTDPAFKEITGKILVVAAACKFFNALIRDGSSPEYFGETVTPADASEVLVRWKLPDGDVRVIYGDLRIETVNAE